jgi:hypothetical protein
MGAARRIVIATLLAALAGGCGDGQSGNNAASSAPTTENVAANQSGASQSSNDVESIMQATASALQREETVLRKAVESMASVDDADRKAYSEVMQQQGKLASQVEALLRDHPTWAESVCGWFGSVVKPAHDRVVPLRVRLMKTTDPGSQVNRYIALNQQSLGSSDKMRELLAWRTNSPGAPENLYVMCIKFGYLKDDGAKTR